MNPTLTQRRKIVERFLAGFSINECTWSFKFADTENMQRIVHRTIEQVLRDFMLRKFKLKEKKR